MEKIEQRACNEVSASLNQLAIIINDTLVKVYGEASYSYPIVVRWTALFKAEE